MNKLVEAKWDSAAVEIEESCVLTTGSTPAYRLVYHPKDKILVCAFATGLKLYDVSFFWRHLLSYDSSLVARTYVCGSTTAVII